VPDSTEALATALRALSGFLVGEDTPRDALQRIARLGEAAVPGAAATGLTLVEEDGHPHTAVHTAETALEVDQLQYDEGDGPCLSAYRQRGVVRIDSNLTDPRWPKFSARATEHGILSAEQAFDMLVRASQRQNRKLRTIAAELVERAQQSYARLVDELS